LAARAHLVVRQRATVPDRDDIVRPDEQMRLPVVDLAGRRIDVSGAQHEEDRVAVSLELRPLVGASGVLDREVVERELLLDLGEHLFVGLVEADPDEPTGLLEHLADVGDRDLADAQAVRVRHALDQPLHARPSSTSMVRRPSTRYASGPVSAAAPRAIALD